MATSLDWMPREAPYMPVASAGLLHALELAGRPASMSWRRAQSGASALVLDSPLSPLDLGELLIETPWPDPRKIPWATNGAGSDGQAIKPILERSPDPAGAFREAMKLADAPEARLLNALLTDGALDNNGVPSRSRLLRGVKADLSGVANRPRSLKPDGLAAELEHGPSFIKGSSGLGLGLVPEVQTFGGTTGPSASTVGAYSPLLYLLLWLGVMALPPVGVSRGPNRSVGGPLVTEPDILSWPTWECPVGLRGLRSLFGLAAIHTGVPDRTTLRELGVTGVYRARAVELSTMVAVYRWGRQVAQ